LTITDPKINEKRKPQSIGDTPLIYLRKFSTKKVKILAKLEWSNPFGSVKDRAADWMLKDLTKKIDLNPDKAILIEPTSGNMGIALAGVAKSMGFKIEVVVPSKISRETKILLRSLGASILETSDDLCPKVGCGDDQSISLAKAIVKSHPKKYVMPNQYENEANYLAHYKTTGPEIWSDTKGKVTHFVTGIGTGGTITGVSQYLKERNKDIRVIAVEAQRNHHLQGLRNLEESMMPDVLKKRKDLIDEWIKVSDKDAFAQVKMAGEKEQLLIGPSSGAVLHVTLELVKRKVQGTIVAIFADDGQKYLSVYSELGLFTFDEYKNLLNKTKYLRNFDLLNKSKNSLLN
jgi:cysteine synthase B